jgi:hypothetical protein
MLTEMHIIICLVTDKYKRDQYCIRISTKLIIQLCGCHGHTPTSVSEVIHVDTSGHTVNSGALHQFTRTPIKAGSSQTITNVSHGYLAHVPYRSRELKTKPCLLTTSVIIPPNMRGPVLISLGVNSAVCL